MTVQVFLPLPSGEGWGEGKLKKTSFADERSLRFPLTLTLSRGERG
jgi:hypothetical protein